MNRDERRRRLPLAFPEGTILRDEEEGGYWFRGRSGWYWLSAILGTCDCISYFWRGAPWKPCRHLQALARFLSNGGTHHGDTQGKDLHGEDQAAHRTDLRGVQRTRH